MAKIGHQNFLVHTLDESLNMKSHIANRTDMHSITYTP